jgi:hypothetical protein
MLDGFEGVGEYCEENWCEMKKKSCVWGVECVAKKKRRWNIFLIRFDRGQALERAEELTESEPKYNFRVTKYVAVR